MSIYMCCASVLYLRQFLSVRDHCPPASLQNVSAQRIFGRPALPSPALNSNTDAVSVQLRWSILVTWSSPSHLRLWATATSSFVLVLFLIWAFVSLSVAPYNLQYSSFHFSAVKFGASSFLLLRVTMFGRRITAPGICRISGRLFCLQCFWYMSASINPKLSNLFLIIPISFFQFLSPCFFRTMSTRILGHNLELLRSVRFLFQRYLALISLWFGIHHLCSVFDSSFTDSCSSPLELVKRTISSANLKLNNFLPLKLKPRLLSQFRSTRCSLIWVSYDSQN